ncbi:MAG: AAA family ATPase [Candidatus Bathyarchaeota archaeon]|nr:AAA family ATPase [Candidatus Bathyarchaeota archaeon]
MRELTLKKLKTGVACLDRQLKGGIIEGVTLIYGEPETGKTTLAMQCAVNCAMQGLKTLFIDCDNTFSAERLSHVAAGKFEEIAALIILMRPSDFQEQAAVIDRLPDYTAKNFGLVVIDTATSLYRAGVAEVSGKAFDLNRELNRQMAVLAQTAKIQKLPIIVTSQVKSVFNEPFVSVAPVATRVVKFWADTIIAMKPTENPQIIKAVLEKIFGKTQEAVCYLRITKTGLHDHPNY